MSVQSQNIREDVSQQVQPNKPVSIHSNHPAPQRDHTSQRQWVASYIDGQYYLTDPQSIDKLKNIQQQIAQEKERLENLEVPIDNASFLSYQEQLERQSNHSNAKTEFNRDREHAKKEKAKGQLEQVEDDYRQKLKEEERRRQQAKKEAVKREAAPAEEKIAATPSRKSAKKSQVKEQSGHKAPSVRVSEKSKLVNVFGNLVNQPAPQEQLPNPSSKSKSVRVQAVEQQPQKSVHSSHKPSHSEKSSQKPSSKHEQIKAETPSQKSVSVKQEDKSVHPSEHPSQKEPSARPSHSAHDEQNKSQHPSIHSSVKQPSVKSSQKVKAAPSEKNPSEHVQEAAPKSVSNKYNIVVNRQDSWNSDEEEEVKSKLSSNIPAQTEKSHKLEAASEKPSKVSASKKSAQPSERSVRASQKSAKPSQKSVKQSQKSAKPSASHSARVEPSHLETPADEAAEPSQKDLSVRSGRTHSKREAEKSERSSHRAEEVKSSKKGSEAEGSQANSSAVQSSKEESVKSSSHSRAQIINKQLEMGEQSPVPHYDMRKKKQALDQSEKKSRSFVIHSRHGSVKERSQKMSRGKYSSRRGSSKRDSLPDNSVSDTVTRMEIAKLHEQVSQLQQQLRRVEERQEEIAKDHSRSQIEQSQLERPLSQKEHEVVVEHSHSPSRVLSGIQSEKPYEHEKEPSIKEHNESHISERHSTHSAKKSEKQESVKNQSMQLEEIPLGLKMQPKLSFQSEIIYVNTVEEERRKQQQEYQAHQKQHLKGEIVRLKKVIREMQMDKIKSIDNDTELGRSNLRGHESREVAREDFKVEKESISSFDAVPTKRKFYNSGASNSKRPSDEAGKIIRNSPEKGLQELSPLRRPNRPKIVSEDDTLSPIDLPAESSTKRQRLYQQIRRGQLSERMNNKESDFHHFIESSRVFAEPHASRGSLVEPAETSHHQVHPIEQTHSDKSKINYSRMVEEMRKNNPEQDQILPEIHLRDVQMPVLGGPPTAQMSQEELLDLARHTYEAVGVRVEEEDRQLCVKKYKNCVMFTVSNNQSDCVLWHFSGKFYMGGWKSGEPGEGQKHGEGLEYVPDKHIYKGQFLNGKKNGTGILKSAQGNIYDGQWIEGVKNGRGVYLDAATKVLYSGDWKDGRKDGHGFLKLSEKEYYYGTFTRSVKEGFGVEMFVNGDKYKGEYSVGKFHGKGKYSWANGSCYEGQFNQGVRHGQGSWKSARDNGDIYIGTYDHDKKNGYGRYVWANGCMYEGGFANDVKHGKGRLTYQDGKQIKGVWEEGNLLTTQNDKKQADHEEMPLRRSVKVNSFGYPSSLRRIS